MHILRQGRSRRVIRNVRRQVQPPVVNKSLPFRASVSMVSRTMQDVKSVSLPGVYFQSLHCGRVFVALVPTLRACNIFKNMR